MTKALKAICVRGHGAFELEVRDVEITDAVAAKGFHEAPQVVCVHCHQPPRNPYFKYEMHMATEGLGLSDSVTPMYSCTCGRLEVPADFIVVMKDTKL